MYESHKKILAGGVLSLLALMTACSSDNDTPPPAPAPEAAFTLQMLHFADADGQPRLGQLPGSFRTGEAAADDMNVLGHAHFAPKPVNIVLTVLNRIRRSRKGEKYLM